MLLANKEGIIVPGLIVNLAVAGAAASLLVFSVPVLANQLIGLKSLKVRKIMLRNNAAGNTTVLLGNGAVGVGIPAILPAFDSLNNLTATYIVEQDFPEVESFANIVAWPVALAVAGTIDIQLEVAVIG